MGSAHLGPVQAALAAWEFSGGRGTVVLPTGSGKTRLAIAVMARANVPTLCLVPTRVLLDQWACAIEEEGDPIFPSEAPEAYDSKLEKRFARELRKATPDWDLIREPEPISVAGTIIFPDFLLRHRLCPERSFLVEIMGFGSEDHVTCKLALLRQAGLRNLILCIDEALACGESDLPADAPVIRFRRRIDPVKVLAAVGVSPASVASYVP